jgi:hypothetical protein
MARHSSGMVVAWHAMAAAWRRHDMARHGTPRHAMPWWRHGGGMTRHATPWHGGGMTRHAMAWHATARHGSMVLCCAVRARHGTAWPETLQTLCHGVRQQHGEPWRGPP